MTDRETLVEILKQAPFEGKVLDEWWWEEKIAKIADHLIANGVTIQNWIPVTECLPEVNTDVTVYNIEGYIGTDFRTTNGNWFWNDELPVTHWMPLPRPPKEVDHDS